MESKLTIEILTPYGRYLKTTIDYLSVTTTSGVLGILPNHSPLIAKVVVSELILKDGARSDSYAISGGLLNIKENSEISLLVNAIEKADDIDIDRALEAKKRAESRLNGGEDIDVIRAKAALARALNRINVFNNRK